MTHNFQKDFTKLRPAKKQGADITYYVRDPNGQLLASYGAGGKLFYFSEFNGSVAAIYNPAGEEVGSYSYSPYGKTTVTGASGPSNPFRYIGGLQDKDSNGGDSNYKLGARYYDAQGHFTQPDPIVPGGGSYNYTEGDPINLGDPSGESAEDIINAFAGRGSFVGSAVGSYMFLKSDPTWGEFGQFATASVIGVGVESACIAGVAYTTIGTGAAVAGLGCIGFGVAATDLVNQVWE